MRPIYSRNFLEFGRLFGRAGLSAMRELSHDFSLRLVEHVGGDRLASRKIDDARNQDRRHQQPEYVLPDSFEDGRVLFSYCRP